ncbi:MAG: hypothetical protein ABGW69_01165 [Nanoarchaeota archaeon]
MNIDLLLDFYLTNYVDLKVLLNNFKENFFYYDFLKERFDLIKKRIELFEEKNNELNKIIEVVNDLIETIDELNKDNIKKKSKKIKEKLGKLIILHKKEIALLVFLFKSKYKIKYKDLIFNKRVFHKINNKDYKEVLPLIKNIIFDGLENSNYKKTNDYYLEIRDGKMLLIVRKDSLYIDKLIIEDILDLENINDFQLYNYYKKNMILPKEEENEELEEMIIENKNKLMSYITFDSIDFLLENYFK